MIVGQEKICTKIDQLTLDSFPRTLMLVGPYGSGKHLIVEYIAKKFNLTVRDITTTLTLEVIEELSERVEPYLYIIETAQLNVKQENTILKFLEEPLKNSYIVLLAETTNGLLPTIVNRCQSWQLQNYTQDTLRSFLTNNNIDVLTVATTPGQVIEFCNIDFSGVIALAEKIITHIEIANIANTLTLTNKVSVKEEQGKHQLKHLVAILQQRFVEHYKQTNDVRYSQGYLLTNDLYKRLTVKNLDYKALFDKYLIQLRKVMRGELT